MMYFGQDYDKRCETMVLTEDEFGKELYHKVGEVLETLNKASYDCVVRLDEVGIVVIEYNYSAYKGFGNETPYWLTEDEAWLCFCDDEDIVPENYIDRFSIYEATKEKDCEPHFFDNEKSAKEYIGDEVGWVDNIYIEED